MILISNPKQLSLTLFSVLGILFLLPLLGHADVAASKRKLGPWAQGLKIEPGMDASGRILRGSEFVGLDLRNANFDSADLGDCEFYQCDLRNACFKNAIFTGVLWGDCDIENADFTDSVINGIKPIHGVSGYGVWFTEDQIISTRSYKKKDLSNCLIQLAPKSRSELATPKFNFREADLRNLTFAHVNLMHCDFTDATITGMGVNGGKLSFAQIASTKNYKEGNLYGVGFGGITYTGQMDLSGIDLTGAKFIGSKLLANANLTDATIIRCTLGGALSFAQLSSTKSYKEGRLVGIKFYNQDFINADFSAQDLSGCYFRDCLLSNANLDNAVISNTHFSQFRKKNIGLTVDQIKSTWNYKHGRMEGVVLPREITEALKKEPTEEEKGSSD